MKTVSKLFAFLLFFRGTFGANDYVLTQVKCESFNESWVHINCSFDDTTMSLSMDIKISVDNIWVRKKYLSGWRPFGQNFCIFAYSSSPRLGLELCWRYQPSRCYLKFCTEIVVINAFAHNSPKLNFDFNESRSVYRNSEKQNDRICFCRIKLYTMK